MPIPAPNLYPAFNIVRLSHVELMVTDLAASRAFYVDTLGLQVTDEDDTVIYLRAMEERGHHCMVLRKGDVPEANYLSYKLYSEADLDKAHDWFAAKGLPVDWVERPCHGPHFAHDAILSACRWSSISRWTGWRRSTRNMRFITV